MNYFIMNTPCGDRYLKTRQSVCNLKVASTLLGMPVNWCTRVSMVSFYFHKIFG